LSPRTAGVPRRRCAPWVFALVTIAAYGLLALPILARHVFDSSVFIVAGDRFVDAGRLVSPIIVQPHSDGYDGQFYYRMALAPLDQDQPAFGIRFDRPVSRMRRILYPVLAWGASLGRAQLVPAALFLLNLFGLGAVGMSTLRLAVRLRLPEWTPFAIMLWPGFIIALTHDTAEIISAALLLWAVDSYLAKRLLCFGVLGALATLTRETSILVLGGIVCFEIAGAARQAPGAGRWRRALLCGLSLIPLPLWWAVLHLAWSQLPRDADVAHDLGLPLLGVATMLRDTLTGVRQLSPIPGLDIGLRAFALGGAAWLLGFIAFVVMRTPAALRRPATGALAAGWLAVLALMSTLTARGPWVEPTAYFRAFTECYIVGYLVLGHQRAPRLLAGIMLIGGAVASIGAWGLSFLQFGLGG